MIKSLDAWSYAVVLEGKTLNGQLDVVSDGLRPLVVHLDGLTPEARKPAWLAHHSEQARIQGINQSYRGSRSNQAGTRSRRHDRPERGLRFPWIFFLGQSRRTQKFITV